MRISANVTGDFGNVTDLGLGAGLHDLRERFVERADLMNRPLRTRTVGGVGAGS